MSSHGSTRRLVRKLALDFVGLLSLAGCAAGLGILINSARTRPLPLIYESKLQRLTAAVAEVTSEDTVSNQAHGAARQMSLQEVQDSIRAGNALILDARPALFYRLGHIPTAISLPREGFGAAYHENRALLEANKTRLLVLYCDGSRCEDSALVAHALAPLGFTNIAIFRGGWRHWREQHLPEERESTRE